jgi:hypothetical protein
MNSKYIKLLLSDDVVQDSPAMMKLHSSIKSFADLSRTEEHDECIQALFINSGPN